MSSTIEYDIKKKILHCYRCAVHIITGPLLCCVVLMFACTSYIFETSSHEGDRHLHRAQRASMYACVCICAMESDRQTHRNWEWEQEWENMPSARIAAHIFRYIPLLWFATTAAAASKAAVNSFMLISLFLSLSHSFQTACCNETVWHTEGCVHHDLKQKHYHHHNHHHQQQQQQHQ